jgi:vanillate monooxygenase ferredoxin subunit
MRTVRIARKTIEAPDIAGFELVDPEGRQLPPFGAGAHIDVHLPAGMVRQYSLCSVPGETRSYRIAVLRETQSRGGSAAMHALDEGALLAIGEPRNHFPLADAATHHLLLAGGIGITPILAMAEQLVRNDASFELHYCTRTRTRTAFVDRIQGSAFAALAAFHFDDGDAAQKLDMSQRLRACDPGTHLYVCGPSGFMDWVLTTAGAAGWSDERLHREYFAAAPADAGADGAFEVQIASTGQVVAVGADQSVVAALAAHGLEIPVSCEQGVCGTCLTRVLSGTPLHRDVFLTPAEQQRGDQFTPCCSRAASPRLVLDL